MTRRCFQTGQLSLGQLSNAVVAEVDYDGEDIFASKIDRRLATERRRPQSP